MPKSRRQNADGSSPARGRPRIHGLTEMRRTLRAHDMPARRPERRRRGDQAVEERGARAWAATSPAPRRRFWNWPRKPGCRSPASTAAPTVAMLFVDEPGGDVLGRPESSYLYQIKQVRPDWFDRPDRPREALHRSPCRGGWLVES